MVLELFYKRHLPFTSRKSEKVSKWPKWTYKGLQKLKSYLYFSHVISSLLNLAACISFPLLPLALCSLHAPSRSQQWQQMSRAEREKTGLIVRDVGEFW